MSKKLMHSVLALALTATPLSAIAGMGAEENINIYGWQNWSYEFVDADKGREYDRLSNNAANIGFMAHMDTGIDGLQVGLRCEQFTYWGRNNVYTDWCNRNSKISLRHETLGEIMFGQWLLPYNEIVAQWIDPFYDAGSDSQSSIMGNIGGNAADQDSTALFYNGSFDDDFGASYGALAFNRRQEGVIQYVWPNTSAMADQSRDGFQFRVAITEGSATDADVSYVSSSTLDNGEAQRTTFNHDERIWSTGVSWQQNLANGGQIWLAVAYESHEDVSAQALTEEAVCSESDDEAYHLAGRYVHDWGNGQRTQLGAMYEELDYEADDCFTAGSVDTGDDGNATSAIAGVATNPVWSGVERDAWMISGKHSFGNGFDFRFSYMDADEWDCDSDVANERCDNDTDAEAYNLGLFYTMPAGTELRLTYSEVQNGDNAQYDFGIHGGSAIEGEDVETIAVGIVHWFD